MTPTQVLDAMINDWLFWKSKGHHLTALACYIAARNYATYRGLMAVK